MAVEPSWPRPLALVLVVALHAILLGETHDHHHKCEVDVTKLFKSIHMTIEPNVLICSKQKENEIDGLGELNYTPWIGTMEKQGMWNPMEPETGIGTQSSRKLVILMVGFSVHEAVWQSASNFANTTCGSMTSRGPTLRDFKYFLDPSVVFPWSLWPKCSTIIQKEDFTWEVVEHCVPYLSLMDYEAEILECNGRNTFVLTVLHRVGTLHALSRS